MRAAGPGRILDTSDTGLSVALTYDPAENIVAPFIAKGVLTSRPKIAILRESLGVNNQIEIGRGV